MTTAIPDAMRMLSRGDVRRALTEVDPVRAVEDAIRAHHAGRTILPSEAYMPWENSEGEYCRSLAMPGALDTGEGMVLGMKVINASVGNPGRGMARAGGFSALFDHQSGRTTMLAEGALVSALRTAAYTVASLRALGPSLIEQITIIGCGHLAHVHAHLIRQHLPEVERLDLFDEQSEASERLAMEWRTLEGAGNAVVHPDARTAVAGAQVVICLTTSNNPYIPRSWLPSTGFVAHASLDDLQKDVFTDAEAVYVDDLDLVLENPRRILGQLLADGAATVTGTLGAVLAGDQEPASADGGLIVSNPFGMAILDVALLDRVQQVAMRLGIGVEVDLASDESLASMLTSVQRPGRTTDGVTP